MTSNSILVAIFHYLFNLRYQKVRSSRDAKTGGRLVSLKSSVARIAKFFGDVSKGGGVRVQQGVQDMLPMLRSWLEMKAADIEAKMSAQLADSTEPLISSVTPTYNTSEAFLTGLLDRGSATPWRRKRYDVTVGMPSVAMAG